MAGQAARISLQQLAKLAERMGRQTSGATEAGLSQKQLDKILEELATAMGEWSAGPKWQQQIAKHADMEAGMAMPHILQQILKGGGGLRLPQQPNRGIGEMMRRIAGPGGEMGSMPGSQF